MTTFRYDGLPQSLDVLPSRVSRRITRRDGLLPLVFAVELMVGVLFGVAAHSGDSAAPTVPPGATVTRAN